MHMIMVDTFKSKIAGRFKKASVVWVATPGALLGPGAARGAILPISPEPILDLSQAFTVQSLARYCRFCLFSVFFVQALQ